MAVIRLILVVAVLGSVTLLLVQNLSPSLPLAFLGMRSRPFPLAVWVLLSIVTGVITSLAISGLFRLDSYGSGGKQKASVSSNNNTPPRRPTSYQRETTGVGVGNSNTQRASVNNRPNYDNDENQIDDRIGERVNQELDDWEQTASEDWDFEDEPIHSSRERIRDRESRDIPREQPDQYPQKRETGDKRRSDEEFEEELFEPDEPVTAKTKKPSADSTYSYNYRQPKQTGVGKTESVYDADYRVLVPPYHPESENRQPQLDPNPTNNDSNDDDWEFLDEFEVEDNQNPQPKDR